MSGATVAEKRRAEPKGLAELYERNAPGAVRLAYLITSDPDLAQDIAQEAFVRVAGRFRHLRVPEAFDAYLRRTVVNLCNSHFRHERVARAALEREAAEVSNRTIDEPDIALRDELRTALLDAPAAGPEAASSPACPRTRSGLSIGGEDPADLIADLERALG